MPDFERPKFIKGETPSGIEPKQEERTVFDREQFSKAIANLDGILSSKTNPLIELDVEELLKKRDVFVAAYGHEESLFHKIVDMFHLRGQQLSPEQLERVREFGSGIAAELIPRVVQDLRKSKPLHGALDFVNFFANRAVTAEQRRIAIDAIDKLQGVISRDLSKQKNFSVHYLLIEDILKWGDDGQKRRTAETIERVISRKKDWPSSGNLVSLLFKDQSAEIMAQGTRIAHSILKQYGLPAKTVWGIWERSCPNFGGIIDKGMLSPYKMPEKNLTALIALEKNRPGICRFLYRKFGIADFGRYPIKLLLQQREDFDNLEKPYGVVLFPRDDWNGAFYATDFFALSNLFDTLQGQFGLRVFECESKIDIARALIKLNRKYNPPDKKGHKISLAIIGGHGTVDSIQFGERNKSRNLLYVNDLMGRGVGRTSEFFEENPTIILISCSTGVAGGIGQELSRVMRAKVVAPKIPANIKEFQVGRRRGGKFRFNAVYAGEKSPKGVYVSGEERPRSADARRRTSNI